MFKNSKFEATGETKEWFGRTLYRIRATADIAALGIVAGTLGGWVEKESNLSVGGNAWVFGSARVYDNAWVSGDARVFGDARVYGNAWVGGDAQVYGDARVSKVNLIAVRSDGYTFTIAPTPDGPRIIAGCRYFSFKQARKHWQETRGDTPLGEETFAILDLLEAQSRIHGFDEPVKGEANA
jgi:carbonic anhydrase/acetyltransferase-like protein (isoleucine patch superfamily)